MVRQAFFQLQQHFDFTQSHWLLKRRRCKSTISEITARGKNCSAHAHIVLFREKMATAAKQAKTEEKNGAENADEQAGKL